MFMKKLCSFLTMLLLAGVTYVQAQSVRITGTVTSSDDGTPLPGVSVVVKGTAVGVATNVDGRYDLAAPADAKQLVFSYIGYEAQTLDIAGRSVIDVALMPSSEQIEEVVVTALGISKEKKALGYASSSFGGDEISSAKVANPMAALSGRVAGLEVTSPAGPGSTQNVMIRGASSFSSNQPLYIVDGVPITNTQNRAGDNLNNGVDFGSGINALNPDDIEEMTVLKGAAATALYGSRAANGIIMIKTKSGKNTDGKMKVTYDGGYTISRVGRLPLEQEQFGQGWSGQHALAENGAWGAAYDGKDHVWGHIVDNSQQLKPYKYLKNRVRDFYDLGKNYKNAVSLYGGNETTNYYASFSQNKIDGVIPTDNDSYSRYTVSTRGEHKGKWIKINSSVNYSFEKTKAVGSGQGESLFRSLNEIAPDISIVDMKDYHNKFYNLDNYFTYYGLNPYYVIDNRTNQQLKHKLFGKMQIDVNPFKNLTVSYRFGGDLETSIAQTHVAKIVRTPGSPCAETPSPENPGSANEGRMERLQINHDLMAIYEQDLGDDFNLNAIVGFNMNERKVSALNGWITSVDVPEHYMFTNTLTPALSSQSSNQRRLMGLYGNVDLSFKNYAYLTLTARNDWSSTLPLDKNSYFYPGATFSFLLSNLLEELNVSAGPLSFTKIRLAYGKTGNDAGTYYIYDTFQAGYSSNPGYPQVDDLIFPLAGVNAFTVSNRLGNTTLQPELTSEFEVGAEVKLFGNRIGLDFSYYNKFTKGLIEQIPIDPSSGYTVQIANLGDIRNTGIELTLDLVPVQTDDFVWTISYNFAKNNNMVENLGVDEVYLSGFGGMGIFAIEGKPMGQFKSTSVRTTEIDGKTCIIVDGSGNPQPTTKEVFMDKDINEKYRMGLNTMISWRGLSLSGTLDFRNGGYMFSYTKDYMHWPGTSAETVMNDRNPFIIPNSVVENNDGTFSENTVPVDPTALHTFYSKGGLNGEAYSVIDRSYLKLRNVSLAYDLPKSLCEKIGFDGITISANANNILLWTPRENCYIDPEVTTFGNDVSAKFGEFGSNPTEQYYSIGLNLKF